jgi:CRP-like cAMP-binding protein
MQLADRRDRLPRTGNRLLDALPADDYARLRPDMDEVSLVMREVVFEPAEIISAVYFPLSGIISLVTPMEDGSTVEVTTVGNEGLVGLPVFLGARSTTVRAVAQVPGRSLRMGVDAFLCAVDDHSMLRALVQRYTQALFTQISQSAGCNRLHSNEERLSRWLLMSHDRVGTDTFPITQEFLSQMLGVRRATVTISAGILQRAGFIAYSRGNVRILDRKGLEAASCECYGVMRSELDRLLP